MIVSFQLQEREIKGRRKKTGWDKQAAGTSVHCSGVFSSGFATQQLLDAQKGEHLQLQLHQTLPVSRHSQWH